MIQAHDLTLGSVNHSVLGDVYNSDIGNSMCVIQRQCVLPFSLTGGPVVLTCKFRKVACIKQNPIASGLLLNKAN